MSQRSFKAIRHRDHVLCQRLQDGPWREMLWGPLGPWPNVEAGESLGQGPLFDLVEWPAGGRGGGAGRNLEKNPPSSTSHRAPAKLGGLRHAEEPLRISTFNTHFHGKKARRGQGHAARTSLAETTTGPETQSRGTGGGTLQGWSLAIYVRVICILVLKCRFLGPGEIESLGASYVFSSLGASAEVIGGEVGDLGSEPVFDLRW